jgi:PAS domain S-box-containing protein
VRLVEEFASSESIVALLSSDDGCLLDVNPAFESITGYLREEAIGRTPLDIGLWTDQKARATLGEPATGRRVVDAPMQVTCSDGRI